MSKMSQWMFDQQAAKKQAAEEARKNKALEKAKADAAKKEANKPTPTPTIAQAQQDTKTYLDTIADIQRDLASGYTDALNTQSASYQQQLASQSASLNTQITNLTQQSNAQVANYETMIARITSQQQNELESMRAMFANQNMQSESMISNLQKEIEKLSRPTSTPEMDVDLSPAVVGISQAVKQSGQRQRLGTKGGLKAQPKTGALGLAIGT
jgi:hypothetical protein